MKRKVSRKKRERTGAQGRWADRHPNLSGLICAIPPLLLILCSGTRGDREFGFLVAAGILFLVGRFGELEAGLVVLYLTFGPVLTAGAVTGLLWWVGVAASTCEQLMIPLFVLHYAGPFAALHISEWRFNRINAAQIVQTELGNALRSAVRRWRKEGDDPRPAAQQCPSHDMAWNHWVCRACVARSTPQEVLWEVFFYYRNHAVQGTRALMVQELEKSFRAAGVALPHFAVEIERPGIRLQFTLPAGDHRTIADHIE